MRNLPVAQLVHEPGPVAEPVVQSLRYWLALQLRVVNSAQQFHFVQSPVPAPVHSSQFPAQSPVHKLYSSDPVRNLPVAQLVHEPRSVAEPAVQPLRYWLALQLRVVNAAQQLVTTIGFRNSIGCDQSGGIVT